MDILYVVGPSANGHRELRWSLRSLARFGKGVGRVIVAGNPPDWLSSDVIRVEVPPATRSGYKHKNILNTILVAIRKAALEGPFLYSSDDHMLDEETDFEHYPHFVQPQELLTRAACEEAGKAVDLWRLSIINTAELLRRNGYTPRQFNCHANTHMDGRDAAEVWRLVNSGEDLAQAGFEPTILFESVRMQREGFEPIVRRDVKLNPGEGFAASAGAWSYSDALSEDPQFALEMEREFAAPCRYESAATSELSRPYLTSEFETLCGRSRLLTCPKFASRMAKTLASCRRVGLESAVTMNALPDSLSELVRRQIPDGRWIKTAPLGLIACTLGHAVMIREAYERGEEHALFLEDDVAWLRDSRKLEDILAALPSDYDFASFGGRQPDAYAGRYAEYESECMSGTGLWRRVTKSRCTAAYALSRRAMEFVLAAIDGAIFGRRTFKTIDQLTDDLSAAHFNVYVAYPNAAVQRLDGATTSQTLALDVLYRERGIRREDYE